MNNNYQSVLDVVKADIERVNKNRTAKNNPAYILSCNIVVFDWGFLSFKTIKADPEKQIIIPTTYLI